MSALVVGTAQLGLPYGITNKAGQVDIEEASALLREAIACGIDTFDTAALYGSSEAVLGAIMDYNKPLKIITKTSKVSPGQSPADAEKLLKQTFEASLVRLRRSSVHGLLAHECDDLLGPCGQRLIDTLESLKREGAVTAVGASVYTGEQIDALLDRWTPDIVQLPFNLLDHRLLDGGQIMRLSEAGVEIHCRSIFLQGLILQPAKNIDAKFGLLAERIEALAAWCSANSLSPLEAAIAFVLGHVPRARILIGVTSAMELRANAAAYKRALDAVTLMPDLLSSLESLRIDDTRILSPALWGNLEDASFKKKDEK